LITTRLTLSRRMCAWHFGQSMPFQSSVVWVAANVIRTDLQYGHRKLTRSSRSRSRSRDTLSTMRATRVLRVGLRRTWALAPY